MLKVIVEVVKLIPMILPLVLNLFKRKQEPVPAPTPDPDPIPEPVEIPNPLPTEVGIADPRIYILWKDRQTWATRVEYCYSVWRGDRDLSYLLSNPGIAEEFKIDLDLVELDIKLMQDLHSRQDPLRLRILTEKHPQFADRCRVRKAKAESFLDEAKVLNRRYDSWVQHLVDGGVVFGVNFDSIKGYIDWRKKNEGK